MRNFCEFERAIEFSQTWLIAALSSSRCVGRRVRPEIGVPNLVAKWRAGQDKDANSYVIEIGLSYNGSFDKWLFGDSLARFDWEKVPDGAGVWPGAAQGGARAETHSALSSRKRS
ncbi:hypothetical protein V3H18_01030 [Methylocystis sp. 9N]|uniref:Uncharacterized protein n=1 Tax=Methylocystis borbori TaxID=3118750 RepID=A0ABU7XDC7_9HYPH